MEELVSQVKYSPVHPFPLMNFTMLAIGQSLTELDSYEPSAQLISKVFQLRKERSYCCHLNSYRDQQQEASNSWIPQCTLLDRPIAMPIVWELK